jgi:hypothetical protein
MPSRENSNSLLKIRAYGYITTRSKIAKIHFGAKKSDNAPK